MAASLVLVVDDERTHPSGSVHLRSSRDALAYLSGCTGCAELWLDHDLGGDDTTRPVALWLAERAVEGDPFPVGAVFVHSMNPVGVEWLTSTLQRFYPVRVARWF